MAVVVQEGQGLLRSPGAVVRLSQGAGMLRWVLAGRWGRRR